MTNNDEHRKTVLSAVLKTLDILTVPVKEQGGEIGVEFYLLGAYTVLNMLGIATDAEYTTLCDEPRKL